jgi:type II secretory pathway pseudopilin PulG
MPNGEPLGRSCAFAASRRFARSRGFAYVLLLAAVAIIAVAATASLRIGVQMSRRDAEQSLLYVGSEFERALRSYAGVPASANVNASNDAANQALLSARGPRTLEELLKDPRTPGIRRHLRQIYADPMTGQQTWGLVKDPAGFIIGVYSLAEGVPIKQTGFAPNQAGFEQAQAYGTWVFGLPSTQLKALTTSTPSTAQVTSQ